MGTRGRSTLSNHAINLIINIGRRQRIFTRCKSVTRLSSWRHFRWRKPDRCRCSPVERCRRGTEDHGSPLDDSSLVLRRVRAGQIQARVQVCRAKQRCPDPIASSVSTVRFARRTSHDFTKSVLTMLLAFWTTTSRTSRTERIRSSVHYWYQLVTRTSHPATSKYAEWIR